MADVSVDATISTATARGMRALVFPTASIGYAFYIDSDGVFGYSKTTNGGTSWGAQVNVDGAGATTVVAFDVWFDKWTPGDTGTLIHCWWFDSTNDIVRWRTLDTNGDTLGTVRAVFTAASAVAGRGAFVSGTKTVSGYLYCAFDIDAGAERGLHRSIDSGTTWSANLATTFVEATLDTCKLFPAQGTGDDNDCWALYYDASATALTLKLWDSSGAVQAESATIQTHTDGTTDLTGQFGYDAMVRHSDGHLIVVAISLRDNASSTHQVFDVTSTSSFATKTAITTNIDDHYYPQIFIDQSTDDLYVAYNGKRDGSEVMDTTTSVYYTKSTDGGTTWTAGDTAYRESAAAIVLQTWSPLSGARFGVMWRVAGTLNFNKVNSVAALSVRVNDAITVTESANAALTPLRVQVSDTLTITESVNPSLSPILLNVSEAITVADRLVREDRVARFEAAHIAYNWPSTVGLSTGQGYSVSGAGSLDKLSQSFTALRSGSGYSATLWAAKGNSPVDSVYLELISGSIDGTVIATSDAIVSSTISSSAGPVKFTFPTPAALVQGTQYWLQMRRTGALDGGNYVIWYGRGTTLDTLAGETWSRHFDPGGWLTVATDAQFTIDGPGLGLYVQDYVNAALTPLVVRVSDAVAVSERVLSESQITCADTVTVSEFVKAVVNPLMVRASEALTVADQIRWRQEARLWESATSLGGLQRVRDSFSSVTELFEVGSGATTEVFAQSFTATAAGNLRAVVLWMYKAGSPSDTVYVELLTGSYNGTVVATSDAIDGADLQTIAGWGSTRRDPAFAFPTPPALTQGTRYWLRVRRTGAVDASHYYKVAQSVTGGDYLAGETSYRLNSAFVLQTSSSIDAGFQALADTGSLIVTEFAKAVLTPLSVHASDAITVTESVTPALSGALPLPVSVSDAITVTEALRVGLNLGVVVSDALTITESAKAVVTPLAVHAADTITVAEAQRVGLNLGKVVNDAVTVTELRRVGNNLGKVVADTVTVTELRRVGNNLGKVVNDAITVAEAQRVGNNLGKVVADTVTVTELRRVGLNLGFVKSETISVLDVRRVGLNLGKVVSESITATDSATRVITPLTVRVHEAITVAEFQSLLLVDVGALTAVPSETVTVLDVARVVVTPLGARPAEPITLAESVKAVVTPLAVHVAETITVTEARTAQCNVVRLTGLVADAITVTESVKPVIPVLSGRAIETVTVGELLQVMLTPLVAGVSDDVTVTDAVETFLFTPPTGLEVVDTIAVTDAVVAALTTIVHFVTVEIRAGGSQVRLQGSLSGRVGSGTLRRVPSLAGTLENLTTPPGTEVAGSLRGLSHGGGTLRRLPFGLTVRAVDTSTVVDHVEVEMLGLVVRPAESVTVAESVEVELV